MSPNEDDRFATWLGSQRAADDAPDLAPGVMQVVARPRRRLPGIAWAAAFLVLALRVFGSFAYLLVF